MPTPNPSNLPIRWADTSTALLSSRIREIVSHRTQNTPPVVDVQVASPIGCTVADLLDIDARETSNREIVRVYIHDVVRTVRDLNAIRAEIGSTARGNIDSFLTALERAASSPNGEIMDEITRPLVAALHGTGSTPAIRGTIQRPLARYSLESLVTLHNDLIRDASGTPHFERPSAAACYVSNARFTSRGQVRRGSVIYRVTIAHQFVMDGGSYSNPCVRGQYRIQLENTNNSILNVIRGMDSMHTLRQGVTVNTNESNDYGLAEATVLYRSFGSRAIGVLHDEIEARVAELAQGGVALSLARLPRSRSLSFVLAPFTPEVAVAETSEVVSV